MALAFWNDPVEAGVDTPEDLERVRGILAGKGRPAREV
jgi:CMP-2-keto-3-deoxyoctulosonic acid synthetase